jgi:hypothetical protein
MEGKNSQGQTQGWGAYMNQKKENQELKKQLIVKESNQNGIRLEIDDKGHFKNVYTDTNALNPFRLPEKIKDVNNNNNNKEQIDPLDAAEIQIQNEIQALQEQLAFSKEVKRKKELFKNTKLNEIEILRDEMNKKTMQYNLDMTFLTSKILELEGQIKNIDVNQFMNEIDDSVIENSMSAIDTNKNDTTVPSQNQENKRARAIVKRRPLYEVIKQPTQFKTLIKGVEFICYTEDGHKIISRDNNNNIKTHNSLNEWLEYCILKVCNAGTTRKSVYEVVLYYNKSKNAWRSLKTDYTSETILLN